MPNGKLVEHTLDKFHLLHNPSRFQKYSDENLMKINLCICFKFEESHNKKQKPTNPSP